MTIYNHGRHSVTLFMSNDYNPESPASSVGSIGNPSLRKLPKKRCARRAQESEDFHEKEFKVQATKYLKKMTEARPEKVRTEDVHFCDMFAKKLRRMAEGPQNEYLKLEIHQLIVLKQSMVPQCWAITFLISFLMLSKQIDFPHQHIKTIRSAL